MTKMVAWTNIETLQFIENYRNEPCIWNPLHEHHKDKIMVYDAWLRIANAMGVPDVTDVKKKKETLMTAFRLNHKKVIASRKYGEEIFKPTWAFYDILADFLADVYESRSTLTSEEHIEPNGNSEGDVDTTIRGLHKRSNRFTNAILKKSLSPVRKYSSGPNTTNGQIHKKTDEFQIYGLYVASQLKSLSEKQSLIAREKIQSILTQCRLQDLRKRQQILSRKKATKFHSEDEIKNVQFVLCQESDNDRYKSKISSSNLNSVNHLDSDTDILEDNFIMHVENIKGEGNDHQDTDSDDE